MIRGEKGPQVPWNMAQIEVKTPEQIELMRTAGRIVSEILDELEKAVAPGVSTWDLDHLAEELIAKKGAQPAFKGYHGFPACLCASVNEEIVHGIPSRARKLEEGDLMKLDFGVRYKGFFGDAARTVPVGRISGDAQALVDVTRGALQKAIEQVVSGNRVGDVSYAVQHHVESHGFSVVHDFVDHGIGRQLHEAPQVPNFGEPGTGIRLRPGMVIAIEPMVNQGTSRVNVLDDEWTAVTADHKLSAHFEHTVAVTDGAPDILTRRAAR